MSSELKKKLLYLKSIDFFSTLEIQRGIEKESLRVDKDGAISEKTHPIGLGSSLTNPYITTDFAEALIEFVTPVFSDINELYEFLLSLHSYTVKNLKDGELLWAFSMPPKISDESSIRIAEYGTSNIGKLKNIYRKGLPVLKKTPKGQPSTNEDTLQRLSEDYELPKIILQYRTLAKLKSTYTDSLINIENPKTKRIHTSYQQAITSTGRLSSTEPNLQNIPIKTAEGRRIREAFVPENGNVLISADYSQIELRIMAHLSEDKNLTHSFNNNIDVHSSTAAEVFGVSIDDVSPDQRRSAKAINFGLMYGMSAFGLTRQLGIPRGEAQEYLDTYFARYTGVRDYMDNIKAQAKEDKYVETIMGRRLYLNEINAANGLRRQAAERAAINAPLQGSAADIIKKAMLDIDELLLNELQDVQMIMQVHDELVFECPKNKADAVMKKMKDTMEDTVELKIPLIADAAIGLNWNEAH